MPADDKCDKAGTISLGPVIDPKTGARLSVQHDEHHRSKPVITVPAQNGESLPDNALFLEGEGQRRKYTTIGELRRGKGPAKVATDDYRDGWDAIFRKQPRGEA